MRKITITDFSGGIQESMVPDDFTGRQWAQLRGIIPSDLLNFESQWPMQTVGTSGTQFSAVYPLTSTAGTFLVALNGVTGDLFWCKAPAPDATFVTSNEVPWAPIVNAENRSLSDSAIAIQANVDYKFLCTVPLQLYKFVTVPDVSDPSNPSKDTAGGDALLQTSGVLINSTTLNGSPDQATQVLIAYIDNATSTVKAIAFPNARRVPMHDEENGDLIKAYVGKDENDEDVYVEMPEWFAGPPYRGAHPYVYLDINATLLPGVGIIPRANVGLSKGGSLLLGDIEWRSDLSSDVPLENEADLESTTGVTEFGNAEYQLQWPAAIPEFSRVVYAFNGLAVYLKRDDNLVGTIIDYSITSNVATFVTKEEHGFLIGETVEVSRIGTKFNGTYKVKAVPSTTSFTVDVDRPDTPSPSVAVDNKEADGTKAILTTATNHNFFEGDTVYVDGVDAALDGFRVILAIPSATTFEFASTATVASTAVSPTGTAVSPVGRSVCFEYKVETGEFQTIPNDWVDIWVTAAEDGTRMKAVSNLNTATHLLNDGNTGPHRGSMYFSTGYDLDMFDPRAVLTPGKSDVQIVGLHQLDDTIIVLTTSGSQSDGVFRIRGRLERIIQYGGASDPTAVRIELIRGGLGAPARTSTTHRSYSTVWSEAGVVVFIDRLGGIWYTNGKDCDRIDRFGPQPPSVGTDDDHAAELGKHLFVWRANRLLCLTMMDSAPDGASGTACWTEVVVPSPIRSMIGAENQLFFVMNGRVVRMCAAAPAAERARFDNAPLTITVSSLTAGDVGSHQRTNWHRVGMTFSTPTGCTVKDVRVQSTGALRVGPSIVSNAAFPDVQTRVTLNRQFNAPGVLGEFVVPAGIGPQALCSFTVTFEGYVQLQSASFWVTGNQPRVGDQ